MDEWFARIVVSMPWNKKLQKVKEADRLAAFGLYCAACCFCQKNLTDGVVNGYDWPRVFPSKRIERIKEALLDAGLFDAYTPDDVVFVHDYLDYNKSKSDIEGEREKKKTAGQRGGIASGKARAKQVLDESFASRSSKTNPETETETETETEREQQGGASTNASTYKGLDLDLDLQGQENNPEKENKSRDKSAREGGMGSKTSTKPQVDTSTTSRIDSLFDAFWKVYPRHPGDARSVARRKYEIALNSGVTPEVLLRGATNYAAYRAADPEGPKFTAMCQTWLNQKRYDDWQQPAAPVVAADDDLDYIMRKWR